jgi:hypothetical protein
MKSSAARAGMVEESPVRIRHQRLGQCLGCAGGKEPALTVQTPAFLLARRNGRDVPFFEGRMRGRRFGQGRRTLRRRVFLRRQGDLSFVRGGKARGSGAHHLIEGGIGLAHRSKRNRDRSSWPSLEVRPTAGTPGRARPVGNLGQTTRAMTQEHASSSPDRHTSTTSRYARGGWRSAGTWGSD